MVHEQMVHEQMIHEQMVHEQMVHEQMVHGSGSLQKIREKTNNSVGNLLQNVIFLRFFFVN